MRSEKMLSISLLATAVLLFFHGLKREGQIAFMTNAADAAQTSVSEEKKTASGCQTDHAVTSLAPLFEGAMKYHGVESFHLMVGQGENLIRRRAGGGFEACSVFVHDLSVIHIKFPLREDMNEEIAAVLKQNPSVVEVHIPVGECEEIARPYAWTRDYVFLDGCPRSCPNSDTTKVFHIVAEDLQDNDHGP